MIEGAVDERRRNYWNSNTLGWRTMTDEIWNDRNVGSLSEARLIEDDEGE